MLEERPCSLVRTDRTVAVLRVSGAENVFGSALDSGSIMKLIDTMRRGFVVQGAQPIFLHVFLDQAGNEEQGYLSRPAISGHTSVDRECRRSNLAICCCWFKRRLAGLSANRSLHMARRVGRNRSSEKVHIGWTMPPIGESDSFGSVRFS